MVVVIANNGVNGIWAAWGEKMHPRVQIVTYSRCENDIPTRVSFSKITVQIGHKDNVQVPMKKSLRNSSSERASETP